MHIFGLHEIYLCSRDALDLKAAAVGQARRATTGYLVCNIVYKIPYRRARAWPSGCIAFRPSALREQRYLAYNIQPYVVWGDSDAVSEAVFKNTLSAMGPFRNISEFECIK